MKALVLTDYNQLEYKEMDKPSIQSDDEVLINIKAVGICGSDIHGMDGSSGRRKPPLIMGHEASGVIVEVGKNVKNWQLGDRVTFDSTIYPQGDWYSKQGMYNLSDNRKVLGVSCAEYKQDGAFAEFITIPEHILHKIPDNVSFEHAAMVEPVAVAAHAIGLSEGKLCDTAVVIGAGLIGVFVIQLLKIKGCSKVIAVDIDDSRLQIAKNVGADIILNTQHQDIIQEIKTINPRGADVVFEAVGNSETVNIAIEAVRKGGRVTLIGNTTPRVEVSLQSIVTRQLTVQGSCAIAGEYPPVLELLSKGKLNLDAVISKIAPLSDGAQWFKRLYQREPGLMKVILQP